MEIDIKQVEIFSCAMLKQFTLKTVRGLLIVMKSIIG